WPGGNRVRVSPLAARRRCDVSDASAGRVYNRIATLRPDRRVSRRELADALGVHYQTIGYLERGEYAPSLHLALRVAQFFGVPVEFVFSTEAFAPLAPGVPDAAPKRGDGVEDGR